MPKPKPKLVIAGPGAGKTHNMVETILQALPDLSPARYMAVITYTNSATSNIKSRLSKKTHIPPNLFIGTIHAFMNRFVVIPLGSFLNEPIGKEKLFIQCQIKDLIPEVEKKENKKFDYKQVASIKANLTKALNEKGYITFDQSLNISAKAIEMPAIAEAVASRIQFLFVDEFQDTSNKIFAVIKRLKTIGKTKIYAVGDPEQYISSYDSSIRKFTNIPILLASKSFEVEINPNNRRCTQSITSFLNQFNGRVYNDGTFQQVSNREEKGTAVLFIDQTAEATHMIREFYRLCEKENIAISERCIVAKNKWLINRVGKALNGQFRSPEQTGPSSVLTIVKDALLSKVQMNQSEFCKEFNCDSMELRMYCVEILQGIANGTIKDEESFIDFATKMYGIKFNPDIPFSYYSQKLTTGLPLNIGDLKGKIEASQTLKLPVVSTIHKMKGLESRAVLAIAKNEEELLLWTMSNTAQREQSRKKKGKSDQTDYPRIGYVAFSRAKDLLCIACLNPISSKTRSSIEELGMKVVSETSSTTLKVNPLF